MHCQILKEPERKIKKNAINSYGDISILKKIETKSVTDRLTDRQVHT